jgi:hypothetical protein
MRKIKHSVYDPHKNEHVYYVCAAYQEHITLCSSWEIYEKFDKETTEPITCPDCLAIIRECQEIKFDWQDFLGQRPDEFRKTKPDPNTESLLHECCLALGWSGGTRAQVLQVLRTTRQLVFDRVSSELNGEYEDFKKDLTVLDNLIRGGDQ